MSGDSLLQVEGLVKHFPVMAGAMGGVVGQVKAVDGVDFSLERGRTLGLVGESGCGKSTVGRCILRLQEPTAGRVLFDGRDLAALPEGELRRLRPQLQIIFQDPFSSLNPRMTVSEIVGEGLAVHGLARDRELEERVVDVLAKVGIPPGWINRYPHEFSGGQRQRISIARAIVVEPRLVVCDEAVSALDVSIQAQVLNLLIALRREMNLAYLFISHDLSVVRHVSDDVAVMYLGVLVEQAPTALLFEAPAHPYTRALLSAIPVADPTRRRRRIALEGDVPTPLDPPAGCRFHTRCPAVTDRCRVEVPPTVELSQGHRVHCVHADGLAGAETEAQRVIDQRIAAAESQRRQVASAVPVPVPALGVKPGVAAAAAPAPQDRSRRRKSPPWLSLGVACAGLACAAMLAQATASAAVLAGLGMAAAAAAGVALWRSALAGTLALALAAAGGSALEARRLQDDAHRQLQAIRAEIASYRGSTGVLPESLSDLRWRLVAIGSADGRDPWGHAWRYRVLKPPLPLGQQSHDFDQSYELGSLGPDGVEGGGDDFGQVATEAATAP